MKVKLLGWNHLISHASLTDAFLFCRVSHALSFGFPGGKSRSRGLTTLPSAPSQSELHKQGFHLCFHRIPGVSSLCDALVHDCPVLWAHCVQPSGRGNHCTVLSLGWCFLMKKHCTQLVICKEHILNKLSSHRNTSKTRSRLDWWTNTL